MQKLCFVTKFHYKFYFVKYRFCSKYFENEFLKIILILYYNSIFILLVYIHATNCPWSSASIFFVKTQFVEILQRLHTTLLRVFIIYCETCTVPKFEIYARNMPLQNDAYLLHKASSNRSLYDDKNHCYIQYLRSMLELIHNKHCDQSNDSECITF